MNQLTAYLHKILTKQELTKAEASNAMQLMLEKSRPEQTAAFLSLLKYRGETPQEIVGMVEELEKQSLPIRLPFPTLDIVGTGGDFANTVNISTGSAIVAAACGIPIIKHGNRAVSSQCGSADVLEALGINIAMNVDQIKMCMEEVNIAFLYAPLFHPSLKKIRPLRKEIGIPTVFNLLGPLLNPAKTEYILMGVAQEASLELISDVVLLMKRIEKALIFHGCGLDEMTTLGKISAYSISHGKKEKIEIDPIELGFTHCFIENLQGSHPTDNALLLIQALQGINQPITDALILNAGAALMIFGKARSFTEGIELARNAIHKEKAIQLLDQWITFSKKTQRLHYESTLS